MSDCYSADKLFVYRVENISWGEATHFDVFHTYPGGDYTACLTGSRRLKVCRRRWGTLVDRLGLGSRG